MSTQSRNLVFDQGYFLPNPHPPFSREAEDLKINSKIDWTKASFQEELETHLLPEFVQKDGKDTDAPSSNMFYVGGMKPIIQDKKGNEKYLCKVDSNGSPVYHITKSSKPKRRHQQIKHAKQLVSEEWVRAEDSEWRKGPDNSNKQKKKASKSSPAQRKQPTVKYKKKKKGRNPHSGNLPKLSSWRTPKDPFNKRFLDDFDFKIKPTGTGSFYGFSTKFITSPAFLTSDEWRSLRNRFLERHNDPKCLYCGSQSNLNCDHVLPRKKYPQLALEMGNLQILCGDCNEDKGNRTMDFRRSVCYIEV